MGKITHLINRLSPTIKKIIGNVGWLFFDKVFRMGVGIFVWVWVARYLGPKDFGLFNYAIAFVAFISPLATLGLDNLVIREVVKNKNARYEILGSAFAMRIVGGVLTLLVALGLISLIRPGEMLTFWLVGIIAAGTLFQSFDVIDLWFQSEVRSKFTVIAKNIAFTIASILKIILITTQAPLIDFAWVSLAEIIIGSAGLVYFYAKENNKLKEWNVKKPRIKSLLKESMPLLIANAAIILYMKIDVVILGQMKGETAVGYYSAATKVSEAFYFVSLIIANSVFPVIINDDRQYYRRFKKLLNITTALAYVIIIPLFLFANTIILIFGPQYVSSGPILAVYTWATMFVFLSVAQGSWYIKEGKTGIYLQMRRTITGLVINVVLNVILIPSMSGLGAAIATIVAYSYVGYFSNIFNKETRKIFLMQTQALLLYGFFNKKDNEI